MLSYYGKSTNLIICPSAPDKGITPAGAVNPPGMADSAWHWTLSTPVYAASYGYNKWLESSQLYGFDARNFNQESAISHPAATPVFMDSAWINLYPDVADTPATSFYDPIDNPGNDPDGLTRICIARHGNKPAGAAPRKLPFGTSILPGDIVSGFYDGHAAIVRLQDLWTYYWSLTWTPTNAPKIL